MKKIILITIICGISFSGCSRGSELIGDYRYSPAPTTIITENGSSGIEIFELDLPNVGEGYYRHILNYPIDADGSNYDYSEYITFAWDADSRDGIQQIAAFTDNENNEKRIYYDSNNKHILTDEDGNIYNYMGE